LSKQAFALIDLKYHRLQLIHDPGARLHRTVPMPQLEMVILNSRSERNDPTNYEWVFVPEEGKTFTDSGTATCH